MNPSPQAIRAALSEINAGGRRVQYRPDLVASGWVERVRGGLQPVSAAETSRFDDILARHEARLAPPPPSRFASLGGMVSRAAGSLTAPIGAVGGLVAGAAGAVVSAGIGALSAVLALTVSLFGALAGALKVTTDAASQLARSLSSMRAANGYSFSAGYDIQRRFGAIGVSQSDTAGLFSQSSNNPLFMALRGAGGAGGANFLPNLAAQYQNMAAQGPVGRILANQQLDYKLGGQVPDALRQALSNLSPSQIRSQQNFSDRINGGLGVNPRVLQEYVSGLSLLQAKLSTFWEAVKVKFGVQMLPLVERVLTAAADYLTNNVEKIAAAINAITDWLMHLPSMLMRFAAQVLRAFAWLLDGLSFFLKSIANHAPQIADVLHGIANGIRGFLGIISGLKEGWDNRTGVGGAARKAADIVDHATNGNAVPAAAAAIVAGPAILRVIGGALRGVAGVGAGILGTAGGVIGSAGIGLGLAGTEAFRRFRVGIGDKAAPDSFGELITNAWGRARDLATGNIGHYDRTVQAQWARQRAEQARGGAVGVAGAMARAAEAQQPDPLADRIAGAFGSASDKTASGAETLRDWAKGLDKGADSWDGEIKSMMAQIAKNTGETADNTRPQQSKEGTGERMLYDLVAAVSALQAQRGTNLQLRR